ncbi:MAG TPA: helical backbone metal receptor [Thermoanaerobaculia bacterium]|jgi:ABC-type Fe3+-hydroxamate transport system substrate-binding protein|nr:helical backbone metal receptor [Thermoanaerobaculia bacterium]
MKDLLGRTFEFPAPPRRVVSLVPSLTETLFDLGAGDDVAGITDFCIFPADLDRPRVGGTKNPRIEEIRALAPDLVYVNLEENLERHAKAIEAFAPVFVTEPKTVDDVAELIATLGAIHHRVDRANELSDALAKERGNVASFTFAVPIWKKPWMWCGGDTYVSNLVESIGGRNVLHDEMRYPSLELEHVLALRPDIVFLPDEPYLFTTSDAAEIPGTRVIGPFPGHLFTWHGTRTILGLRFLRDCFA